jgi:hypothetical protein
MSESKVILTGYAVVGYPVVGYEGLGYEDCAGYIGA